MEYREEPFEFDITIIARSNATPNGVGTVLHTETLAETFFNICNNENINSMFSFANMPKRGI